MKICMTILQDVYNNVLKGTSKFKIHKKINK